MILAWQEFLHLLPREKQKQSSGKWSIHSLHAVSPLLSHPEGQ